MIIKNPDNIKFEKCQYEDLKIGELFVIRPDLYIENSYFGYNVKIKRKLLVSKKNVTVYRIIEK